MSKITKSLEESYSDHLAEQQAEETEQLASYQAIKEWLQLERNRGMVFHSREVKFSQLDEILDLCAKLVTADARDHQEIVAEIEEVLR